MARPVQFPPGAWPQEMRAEMAVQQTHLEAKLSSQMEFLITVLTNQPPVGGSQGSAGIEEPLAEVTSPEAIEY